MTSRLRVALTLLAALFALAFPAAASAEVFTVNSTGDEPDASVGIAGCLTAGLKCTLRAAIQESNATAGVKDTILFDLSVFEGQLADTIAPATVLPPLSSAVEINAGTCATAAGIDGPCAGVNGPSGEVGLEAAADETSISGLALTGLSFAIVVGGSSSDFTARGNWIGVKLDGTAGGNSNFGIFVDPNSDGATIGGTEAVQRNVIANTTGTALDLEGASEATIQGNYFGVGPDGETQMSNGKNIEITDRAGFIPSEDVAAEDNEIGATVAGAAATSAACDGGCNVVSGSLGTGIDLNGSPLQSEKPATGPTVVHGNFVGLDASGTATIANSGAGVLAGGAKNVTVGGPAAGDANYVAGGNEGIVSLSGGQGFQALGNSVGFGSDGSEQTAPLEFGILALNLDVTEDSKIEDNAVRMNGGIGVETRFLTGRIVGNEIAGGNRGIVAGFGEGEGLIAGNEVDASAEFGILVESPKNDVRDNTVTDSSGTGIAVKPPPGVTATTGNAIGGSSSGNENVIDGSAGPAIEVVEEAGEAGSWTEITRNHGSGNGGLFIDLKTGANEGVVSPAISSALKTSAEGTGAEPGATIRVFRKASGEAGELQSFLAETVADDSGNWKATYSVPGGTIVAATQTKETGATSELSTATVPADPSDPCKDALPAAQCAPPAGPPVTTPPPPATPDTKITKAPKAKSSSTTAKFKFKSTVAGSGFECKLDKGKFKKCKSPKTYKKLKPGKHVFKVRAVGPTGVKDPTPAKRKFTVLG
ncbi:MAG TPA: NosD domain-containing protein [Solirubrobacterales bacterium]|nr:NosD domain-containing protein [Solirubrobacterales bacterium]